MVLELILQRAAVCERYVMEKPITSPHFPWQNVEVPYQIVAEDLLVKQHNSVFRNRNISFDIFCKQLKVITCQCPALIAHTALSSGLLVMA